MPDEAVNRSYIGRPGSSRGESAFPKLRFVSLLESGTHLLVGAVEGPYRKSEAELAREVLSELKPGMLCMADRGFFSYDLWREAAATGADLLWRVKKDLDLPRLGELEDGSYLSRIYPPGSRRSAGGIDVRVVEYVVVDEVGNLASEKEPCYRLVTTILDPEAAPAEDLAALYQERWCAGNQRVETALDELKTHLTGRSTVLRSKTPALVRQEFYGLLLAHYVVRGLMHEAALKADVDPDGLSFTHAVRVVRRKMQAQRSVSRTRHSSAGRPFPPSGNLKAP